MEVYPTVGWEIVSTHKQGPLRARFGRKRWIHPAVGWETVSTHKQGPLRARFGRKRCIHLAVGWETVSTHKHGPLRAYAGSGDRRRSLCLGSEPSWTMRPRHSPHIAAWNSSLAVLHIAHLPFLHVDTPQIVLRPSRFSHFLPIYTSSCMDTPQILLRPSRFSHFLPIYISSCRDTPQIVLRPSRCLDTP